MVNDGNHMQLIESIRELSLEEIRDIYTRYLYYDFPFDERKPLDRIEKSMRDGQYLCLGAWNKDGIFLAYAFFVVIGKNVLLDYYAVVPEYRGTGIGTSFLPLAASKTNADCLIIEIEDPDSANDPEESSTRLKRRDFYLRAGCILSDVRAHAFGVDYLLLEYHLGKTHSSGEIAENYLGIYRTILPHDMYEANLSVDPTYLMEDAHE